MQRQRSDASTSSASSNSGGQSDNGDPLVYPFTIHHNGRLGGPFVIYAESSRSRTEWRQKFEEATGLRKVVQESNKVFEIETLSMHTFSVPPLGANLPQNETNPVTGRVTCSIPFSMLFFATVPGH